jgi:hypothetical protein
MERTGSCFLSIFIKERTIREDLHMKTLVLAIALAFGALFGLSAQAAPATSDATAVQGQVKDGALKVWHCRRWSGGWGCGGGWGHGRRWSHRRRGSWWR